jgi:hypothetical protein
LAVDDLKALLPGFDKGQQPVYLRFIFAFTGRVPVALYLISYDINEKDSFEYEGLWSKLEELGAVRILYSEWVMRSDVGRAGQIYSAIAPLTQKKDRLLVQEITNDAVWDKLLITDGAFQSLITNARG